MLRPVQVTPPDVRLLSTTEAKAHLRVDHNDDDGLIDALIMAAEMHLDGWAGILGRCLVNQVWRLSHHGWPSGCMDLVFPDVSSVSVAYFDAGNQQRQLDTSDFELIEAVGGSYIKWASNFSAPSLFDRVDAVQVTITAGFGPSASDVPMPIRQAVKLMIGAWYAHRENIVIGATSIMLPAPVAAHALLTPYSRNEL